MAWTSVRAFARRWWSSLAAGPVTALLLGGAAIAQNDTYRLFGHDISWPVSLVILAAAVALGGTFETSRKLRRLEHGAAIQAILHERASRVELALIEATCDDLKFLVDTLGLFSYGRASVFLCRQDHFILVGRYSPMARYGRSIGRETYPIGAGILGKAWDNGEADDPELPDPGVVNRPPTRAWLSRQASHGIPDGVASNFVMRSRAYAAVRLEFDRRRLGVLVIETDRPAKSRGGSASTIPAGSIEALREQSPSRVIYSLSRSLEHLRKCDDGDLRRALVGYLPDH